MEKYDEFYEDGLRFEAWVGDGYWLIKVFKDVHTLIVERTAPIYYSMTDNADVARLEEATEMLLQDLTRPQE